MEATDFKAEKLFRALVALMHRIGEMNDSARKNVAPVNRAMFRQAADDMQHLSDFVNWNMQELGINNLTIGESHGRGSD